MSGGSPSRAPAATASSQRRHGRHPTGPGGDDRAAQHVAGGAPDDRLEHPSAVERQAGHQVEQADEEVGAREALHGHQQQPVGRHEPQARAPRRPTASEVSGPTTAIMNSWRGVRASPSMAVTPPRKCRVIEETWIAVVPGHERVRRLVQQHREVEDHREGAARRRTSGHPARARPPPRAARPPRRSARRSRNQEVVTSTSLPAMVPTLKVPGGRARSRAWSAACGTLLGHVSRLCRSEPARGRPAPDLSARSPRVADMSVAQDSSPAERVSTPVDGVDVLGAISPSRAADFMTCPLLYRFRTVDRLPEPSSVDAVRGTLVHKVLEDLFDLPAAERTPEQARDLLVPTWEALLEPSPELAELFTGRGGRRARLPRLADLLPATVLDRYFTLEDPRRLEPAERELYVETLLDSRLLLRGFVDRLDVAPDGAIRVVDYKTGRSPGETFEAKALFQMKFYALVDLAHPRRRAVDAAAGLPRQRRDAALRPRRGRPARHRAQGRGGLAGDPPGRGDRRLAAQPVASCATGAPTRRSARRGAALPRRCPSASPAGPTGRRRRHRRGRHGPG